MTCKLLSYTTLEGSWDTEGHRTYWLTFRVWSDDTDGPANVSLCPGMPLPGAFWQVDNDLDIFAWVRADRSIKLAQGLQDGEELATGPSGGAGRLWDVQVQASTKPPDWRKQRCQDIQIQDPIAEPPRISGSFVKYSQEYAYDMNGVPITNSAFELIRGPQAEYDANRETVVIEQNVLDINIPLLRTMANTLNQFPLWGCPTRTIKLEPPKWERRFWGQCIEYFNRTLEFSISADFDRTILDEGTKVLKGRWERVQGSGVTFNITAVNGGITVATVANGGTGYPKLAMIGFIIVGAPSDGIVQAFTDGNGVVVGTQGVYYAGTGYATGTASGLNCDQSQWVVNCELDHLNSPRVPLNTLSSNFGQFVDRNGNATKCVLDGKGLPFGNYDPEGTIPALTPGKLFVQKYGQSDFIQLGIPLVL